MLETTTVMSNCSHHSWAPQTPLPLLPAQDIHTFKESSSGQRQHRLCAHRRRSPR